MLDNTEFRVLENDGVIGHLYKIAKDTDKTIAWINQVHVRNTLDHYKDHSLYCTRTSDVESIMATKLLEYLKEEKYNLGLDITKNVHISISYLRCMDNEEVIQFII